MSPWRERVLQAADLGYITEMTYAMPRCFCPVELGGATYFEPVSQLSDSSPTHEHFPIAKRNGGHRSIDNAVLAHRPCNRMDYSISAGRSHSRDLERIRRARDEAIRRNRETATTPAAPSNGPTEEDAEATGRWAGVDVGGYRKGFHLALVDDSRVLELDRASTPDEAAALAVKWQVALVAVDSPASAAPHGETSRRGERELVRAGICNIRWTPDADRLQGNPYYEWIEHGFALYSELAAAGVEAVECFPTASWTRWAGRRGDQSRAVWSTRALAAIGVALPPRRLAQDQRDAIGAALTARAHSRGETESFGDIVVPLPPKRGAGPTGPALSEVVAAVAQEWASAGHPLSVPPDFIRDESDELFWQEVERRFESERS